MNVVSFVVVIAPRSRYYVLGRTPCNKCVCVYAKGETLPILSDSVTNALKMRRERKKSKNPSPAQCRNFLESNNEGMDGLGKPAPLNANEKTSLQPPLPPFRDDGLRHGQEHGESHSTDQDRAAAAIANGRVLEGGDRPRRGGSRLVSSRDVGGGGDDDDRSVRVRRRQGLDDLLGGAGSGRARGGVVGGRGCQSGFC